MSSSAAEVTYGRGGAAHPWTCRPLPHNGIFRFASLPNGGILNERAKSINAQHRSREARKSVQGAAGGPSLARGGLGLVPPRAPDPPQRS